MTKPRRYYSNLLDAEHRVLPAYFCGEPYIASDKKEILDAYSLAFGITLLVLSLFAISYTPFFLVIVVTGLLLIPNVNSWLQRTLRFRITMRVRIFFFTALLATNIPFAMLFNRNRILQIERDRLETIIEVKARRMQLIQEKQRTEALNDAIEQVREFSASGKTEEGLQALRRVDSLTATITEKSAADKMRIGVTLIAVKMLMKKRQYTSAIILLDSTYLLDTNHTEVLYQRALCYSKTHRIAAAVKDAKRAMLNGNEQASALYEKLNPIRTRVIYYETLCYDGTTSDVRGRGACSHHGGVAEWNHPVYEQYRKYD